LGQLLKSSNSLSPDLFVFGLVSYPVPAVRSSNICVLTFTESKITVRLGADRSFNSEGAVGNPAGLAILLDKIGEMGETSKPNQGVGLVAISGCGYGCKIHYVN
jgi:hypothetical protein